MGDRPRVLYSVVRALVPCTNLATHSQCYGVVYYRDLLQYSEKKMLKEVSARGVVHFQKADGVLTPTPALLLTLDRLAMPKLMNYVINVHGNR